MFLFHQIIYELWKEGALAQPLARIKVDEQKLLWHARVVRNTHNSTNTLPHHYAVTCLKHAVESHVEQPCVNPIANE